MLVRCSSIDEACYKSFFRRFFSCRSFSTFCLEVSLVMLFRDGSPIDWMAIQWIVVWHVGIGVVEKLRSIVC